MLGDLYPYYPLDLLTIRDLERTKIPYIERLKEMRWIERYVKYNDIISLIEILEVDWVVAFIAIKDK